MLCDRITHEERWTVKFLITTVKRMGGLAFFTGIFKIFYRKLLPFFLLSGSVLWVHFTRGDRKRGVFFFFLVMKSLPGAYSMKTFTL